MTQLSNTALLAGLDRAQDLYDSLHVGDDILVRFGSSGSQSASVHGFTRDGRIKVRKYRARSRSYTKPVIIDRLDILRRL